MIQRFVPPKRLILVAAVGMRNMCDVAQCANQHAPLHQTNHVPSLVDHQNVNAGQVTSVIVAIAFREANALVLVNISICNVHFEWKMLKAYTLRIGSLQFFKIYFARYDFLAKLFAISLLLLQILANLSLKDSAMKASAAHQQENV